MLESELTKQLGEVFNKPSSWGNPRYEYNYNPQNNTLIIRVCKEYDFVDITFEHLEKVSKIVGSKSINIGDKESYGGCETCDYGSSYEISLVIRNCGITLEKDPPKASKR